ncbi:hypothetical protein PMI22_05751 [Pseudomonas sp. GM21]|nr:hypothetical protein PMI22_05751 [Pseudomonas sp. GM21]
MGDNEATVGDKKATATTEIASDEVCRPLSPRCRPTESQKIRGLSPLSPLSPTLEPVNSGFADYEEFFTSDPNANS